MKKYVNILYVYGPRDLEKFRAPPSYSLWDFRILLLYMGVGTWKFHARASSWALRFRKISSPPSLILKNKKHDLYFLARLRNFFKSQSLGGSSGLIFTYSFIFSTYSYIFSTNSRISLHIFHIFLPISQYYFIFFQCCSIFFEPSMSEIGEGGKQKLIGE